MPRLPRSFAAFAAALAVVALPGAAAQPGLAAEGRLYPSGPPHGVAYLRFANLSPDTVKIVSPAAELSLPADDGHRVGEFDPVTPGHCGGNLGKNGIDDLLGVLPIEMRVLDRYPVNKLGFDHSKSSRTFGGCPG